MSQLLCQLHTFLILSNVQVADCYTLLSSQINVEATDKGTPRLFARLTITVNIFNNQFSPQFIPSQNYAETVDQTLNIGSNILTVTATDNDQTVSSIHVYCSHSKLHCHTNGEFNSCLLFPFKTTSSYKR